jgi:hypothetical protein
VDAGKNCAIYHFGRDAGARVFMSRKTKSGTLPDPITRKNRLAGGNHMGGVASAKQSLSLELSVLLVFTIGSGATTGIADQGTGTAPTGGTASSYPGLGVAATAEELQSLVAPIALYPESLVAQILTAATFPDEVAIASYWVGQNKTLTNRERTHDGGR